MGTFDLWRNRHVKSMVKPMKYKSEIVDAATVVQLIRGYPVGMSRRILLYIRGANPRQIKDPVFICRLSIYISGCSAVGSACDLGSRGREFESLHSDHAEYH